MLRILSASECRLRAISKPGWTRVYIEAGKLRLFCGHLIVLSLEGEYVWLATDPASTPPRDATLESWRRDVAEKRPPGAKGEPYPEYKVPPSVNGFYIPSQDPLGVQWTALQASHFEYLERAATVGRAPDPRTTHEPAVVAAIHELLDADSPAGLDPEVRSALSSDPESRRRRLFDAPTRPVEAAREVRVFLRNADVVAEVLLRAAGVCELCGSPAPFLRASDGTPYLEVHHKVPLGAGGDDTVENAVALCPNCHRKQHYG